MANTRSSRRNLQFVLGAVQPVVDRKLPVLGRTYRNIRDEWYYRKQKAFRTEFGFCLAGANGQDRSRLASGEIGVFRQLAENADIIVDVGANVGLFSCLGAQIGLSVVAIEPHPKNVQLLCRNVRENGYSQVEILPVALSDKVGVESLFGSMEGATLLPVWAGIGKGNSEILVPTTTLDSLLSGRFTGKRLLVKLDVEGNEYQTIRGAQTILGRTPAPVWIIEHGLTENFSHLNPHFMDLFASFWSNEYRSYVADEEQREVLPADVQRWVDRGVRDFGGINFIFKKD